MYYKALIDKLANTYIFQSITSSKGSLCESEIITGIHPTLIASHKAGLDKSFTITQKSTV